MVLKIKPDPVIPDVAGKGVTIINQGDGYTTPPIWQTGPLPVESAAGGGFWGGGVAPNPRPDWAGMPTGMQFLQAGYSLAEKIDIERRWPAMTAEEKAGVIARTGPAPEIKQRLPVRRK